MFVVVVSTVLAGLTVSYSASVRVQALGAQEENHTLHAELAAESGMDYARRRLTESPGWRETEPSGVTLADGSRFVVTVEESDSQQSNLVVTSQGFYGEAYSKLVAEATLSNNGGADKALVHLGGVFTMDHVYGWGDIVIADDLGVVKDWVVDEYGVGSWQPGGSPKVGDFAFHEVTLYGNLQKYTENSYLPPPASEEQISGWQYMPAWDLDSYLTERPGLTILQDVYALQGLNTEDTVVVVNPPYTELKLKNCYIGGGLVMWAPRDWDTRGSYRNRVKFMSGCEIGGGDQGAETTLGVLAPASEINSTPSAAADIRGFNLWHTVKRFAYGNLWGQTFIFNRSRNISHICFWYEAPVALNPPTGITPGGTLPQIDFGQMVESY